MSNPEEDISTIEKGNSFVEVIKSIFEEKGYEMKTILSSKPFDLIGKKDDDLIAVEVKYSGGVGKKQYEKQLEIAKRRKLIYYTATRDEVTGAIQIIMRYHPVLGEIKQ